MKTPSSLVLLTSTEWENFNAPDRGLSTPERWHKRLEVPVGGEIVVREEVLVGDPPERFDCVRSEEMDARCAG